MKKISVEWRKYSKKREILFFCHNQQALGEIFLKQDGFFFGAVFDKSSHCKLKDEASAKAWVEEQLGVESDNTPELKEKLADAERALELAAESCCDGHTCYRCPVQEKCPKPPWDEDFEPVEILWMPYYLSKAKSEREGGTGCAGNKERERTITF